MCKSILFRLFLIFCILFIFTTTNVFADSLWGKDMKSLYSSKKSSKVGDLITIYISVTSSAIQEAGTQTSKKSGVNANFFDAWDQVAIKLGSDESLRKTQQY